MKTKQLKILFWLAGFLIFGGLLHVFSGILLPFVVGMAIAYFLDPVADWLEKQRITRAIATAFMLLSFFILSATLIAMLFPLLQRQVVELFSMLPMVIEAFRVEALPWLEDIVAGLPKDTMGDIRETATSFAAHGVKWVTMVVANLWSGGLVFFNILSLIVITPVVSFYLLRDWDVIIEKIDSWLPRRIAPIFREQATAIDQTLAAFVRGQFYVCLALAAFYGVGLTFVGLKSGLLVGFSAGLMSFIPYVGAALGLAVGLGIAISQFPEWPPIILVVAIFMTGQTLESYILTPRLVGDGVGLHPVWIIFALLAGGSLFGFTGVLLAVPVAAIIGVLTRFAIDQYLDSPLYDAESSTVDESDA